MMIRRQRRQKSSSVSFRLSTTTMRWTLALLLVAILPQAVVESLQIGKLFERFQPKVSLPTMEGILGPSPIAQTKEQLLKVISNTGNGKDASLETQKNALQLVRYLETNAPTPKNLLENPEASKALNGVWFLQYTAPSELDTEDTVRVHYWFFHINGNPPNSLCGLNNKALPCFITLSTLSLGRRPCFQRIVAKGSPRLILEK